MKVSLCCGALFVGPPQSPPADEPEIGICPLCLDFCEIVDHHEIDPRPRPNLEIGEQSSVLFDTEEESEERNYGIE